MNKYKERCHLLQRQSLLNHCFSPQLASTGVTTTAVIAGVLLDHCIRRIESIHPFASFTEIVYVPAARFGKLVAAPYAPPLNE